MVADGLTATQGGEGAGLLAQVRYEVAGLLLLEPVLEAAMTPIREILLGNGLGVELFLEDGLDFGLLIKPGKDGAGGFVVIEAAVKVVADEFREARPILP